MKKEKFFSTTTSVMIAQSHKLYGFQRRPEHLIAMARLHELYLIIALISSLEIYVP